MLRSPLLAALVLIAPHAVAAPVWQPIIDYTISFPGDRADAAPAINPFDNFTHFASDFGWMGPGGGRIDAKRGIIRVKPDGEWTGAWHSLAGLATQRERVLDPNDLIGLGGDPAKRCGIRALAVNVEGKGLLRLELADAQRKVLWNAAITLDDLSTRTHTIAVDPERVKGLKFMNWIAEPGCDLRLSSIGFMAERPEMSSEEWAFRISLGKLRRCHDAASGFTRDRGHIPAGEFDTVAATGMHALASALAAEEGILERGTVVAETTATLDGFSNLSTAYGFLPHFVHRGKDGRHAIVSGTEYSTVDTAIALHSLLLATRILNLPQENQRVVEMVRRIQFDPVTSSDGWISHGLQDDGKTLLQASWRDWGGETAIVLALEAMIPNRQPRGAMLPTGQPFRGVGFIAEIKSLFYPDFNKTEPDLVSGISWPEIRRRVLNAQIAYPKQHWPNSAAARSGIFGLSAGEAGMPGAGYTANGTDVPGLRWLHPHYMVMGLALSAPELYPQGLRDLDKAQLLLPLGLPENIEIDFQRHNPMQGALNAAFESLSTYHGWKSRNTPGNRIDSAALQDPLLRQGAARFYK